jgi:hypothetical protein
MLLRITLSVLQKATARTRLSVAADDVDAEAIARRNRVDPHPAATTTMTA